MQRPPAVYDQAYEPPFQRRRAASDFQFVCVRWTALPRQWRFAATQR
jgi:hypothetical protein